MADGPAGENSPLFFENRRQHGLAARDLTEKLAKTGGTPLWGYPPPPPNLYIYNFFVEASTTPKPILF